MTTEEQEAITRLKESLGGKALIKELKRLIHDDVLDILQMQSLEVGKLGQVQGAAVRTQVLLHLLEAEYVPDEEID